MGLFLRQDEQRSELQSKIIADLQQKVRQTTEIAAKESEKPESSMLENQHETQANGVIIGLLVVAVVIVVIFIVARSR